MSKRWPVALLLAFLVCVGVLMARVGSRGRFAIELSTLSAGPEGTKALFALTQSLGYRAERLTEDYGRLRPDQVLVVLGRCDGKWVRKPTEADRDALVRFVEQGGALWVLGPSEIDERLGVRFTVSPLCKTSRTIDELLADPPSLNKADDDPESLAALSRSAADVNYLNPIDPRFASLGMLTFHGVAQMELVNVKSPGVILTDDDDDGDAHMVRFRRGRGEIIALSSASIFENNALSVEHGAALWDRMLRHFGGRRVVVFDEFHTGIGDRRSTVAYLVDRGLAPFLMGSLFALFALVWRLSERAAPERDEAYAPAGGLGESVRGLGTLYRRVNDVRLAFDVVRRAALSRIGRKHHVEAGLDASFAQRLTAAGRARAATAVRALAAIAPSDAPRTQDAWLAAERELDRLTLEACKEEGEP